MTIEQHAEAAAKDIASWMRLNAHLFLSVGNQAELARLIQLRIDEATAPLRARIAELETLNQGYRLRCHSAERDAAGSKEAIEQWRQRDAITTERLEKAKARIAKLEGLGSLIERLEREIVDAVISNRNLDTDPAYAVAMTEIDAILKGGAS